MDAWLEHRAGIMDIDTAIDAWCALLFNGQGYLHELLKMRDGEDS
jgi:hypothetical protein